MAFSVPALRGSLMRRLRAGRLAAVCLLAGAALLLIPIDGFSQEQVPGSPACRLSPVTLPLFDATPAAVIAATPVAAVAGAAPADTATIEGAIATIVACINMGDPALRYAVFTDRYLAKQLADPTVTYQPAFEQRLDVATDPDIPQFSIVSIEEVVPLDDGRVSVVVTLAADGMRYEDRLVLAYVGGDWLIDEVELIDPASPEANEDEPEPGFSGQDRPDAVA